MDTLKTGDVVCLKSGGPSMTIGRLGKRDDGTEVAYCSWIDDDGHGTEYSFPIVCLKKN